MNNLTTNQSTSNWSDNTAGTMDINVTEKEHFRIVKDKWKGLTNRQIEKLIDPAFVDFIKKINRHPDLATVYCCSGHPDKCSETSVACSYMVILVRTRRTLDRFKALTRWIESQKGYHPLARTPGWTYLGGSIFLLPHDYNIPDVAEWPKANSITLYCNTNVSDYPTNTAITAHWEDMFNRFIFGEKLSLTDEYPVLHERINNNLKAVRKRGWKVKL